MDTQQAQGVAAMMAGMGMVMVLFVLACFAFVIFLLWRIFSKAGYSGAMAFLILIPGVGALIALCILAFGQWKVVPVTSLVQVQPGYPPASYPPTA